MEDGLKSSAIPLLQSSSSTGAASKIQTLGNIIISIVGTGILGLPFAFRIAGSLGVIIAGIATYYCMLLLIGLCLGLAFTFPIMAHPIHEIVEGKLKSSEWYRKLYYKDGENPTSVGKFGMYVSRAILIIVLALLASYVPGFGLFASFVGSTVCALISFVLPSAFHLQLFGSSSPLWQKALDYLFVIVGLLFAAYGTYNTIVGV